MGVLIGSAVFPIAACLLWSKVSCYYAGCCGHSFLRGYFVSDFASQSQHSHNCCWLQCTKWGAISGALIGQWAGLIFWLVWTKVRS
jgi:Na+/proline symporter